MLGIKLHDNLKKESVAKKMNKMNTTPKNSSTLLHLAVIVGTFSQIFSSFAKEEQEQEEVEEQLLLTFSQIFSCRRCV